MYDMPRVCGTTWLIFALVHICVLSTSAAPQWAPTRRDEGVGTAAGAPRIGVLVQGPAVKGLFRDAECLVWALARDPVRLNGRVPAALSVFFTSNYALLDMAVGAGLQCIEDQTGGRFCATADALPADASTIFRENMVAAGTDVREWLKTLDVVVVFESTLRSFFGAAHKLGVRQKVLVLNIDWTEPNALLALHAEVPGLQLWAKGNATLVAVASLMHDHFVRNNIANAAAIVAVSVALVPWSIPDAVVREDSRLAYFHSAPSSSTSAFAAASAAIEVTEPPWRRRRQGRQKKETTDSRGAVRFLFIAGLGGIRNRRGGDIVLEVCMRVYVCVCVKMQMFECVQERVVSHV